MGQLRNSFCFQHQSNQLTVENAFRLKSVTQFLFLCLDLDCIIDVGLWANISFFPTPTGQFRLCFLSPMAKRVLNNISYYCFCYFFCLECLCSHCPTWKIVSNSFIVSSDVMFSVHLQLCPCSGITPISLQTFSQSCVLPSLSS